MNEHDDVIRVGPPDDPDKYCLGHPVGRGGQGQVYRGWVQVDGRPVDVAIKVIALATEPEIREWQVRATKRETELLRTIPHTSIVPVREAFEGARPHYGGQADQVDVRACCYLVMGWVEGDTLATWVADHPDRTYSELFRIITCTASALGHLHAGEGTNQPVFHRDVKPANIIVRPDLSSVLVDFGIAAGASVRPLAAGTAGYMAPELRVAQEGPHGQSFPAPATPESDLYGLAAVVFFLFTGQHVPERPDEAQIRTALQAGDLMRSQPTMVDFVIGGLHPDPAVRAQWLPVQRWAGNLQAVTESAPVGTLAPPVPDPHTWPDERDRRSGRPKGPRRVATLIAAGLAVAVLAIALTLLATRHDRDPEARDATTTSRPNPGTSEEPGTTTSRPASTTSRPTTTTTEAPSGATYQKSAAELLPLLLTPGDVAEYLPSPQFTPNEYKVFDGESCTGAMSEPDPADLVSTEINGVGNAKLHIYSYAAIHTTDEDADTAMRAAEQNAPGCGYRIRPGEKYGDASVRLVNREDPANQVIIVRRGNVIQGIGLLIDSTTNSVTADALGQVVAAKPI